MTERWRLKPFERERLRTVIGQLLLGLEYKPEEPLIKQLAELRGQRLGLLGFLATSQTLDKPKEEDFPMPEDYWNSEEWKKLSLEEKRRIYEALKAGRKIYVAKTLEEGKRAMLDSDILMGHKLKNMLKQF